MLGRAIVLGLAAATLSGTVAVADLRDQYYSDALRLRQKVMADFSRSVFEKADVLHLPVIPIEVPTISESDIAANPGFSEFLLAFGHCTRPFNYLGLPAISVPAGVTPNGLPCGFQLVGRPFDEETLLAAAHAYEQEAGAD